MSLGDPDDSISYALKRCTQGDQQEEADTDYQKKSQWRGVAGTPILGVFDTQKCRFGEEIPECLVGPTIQFEGCIERLL